MSETPDFKRASRRTPMSEGKMSNSRRSEFGEPSTPRTPKSAGKARHGLWKNFNGLIVDTYSEVGSVGSSYIVGTPGALPLPNRHNSQARILSRALKYPLPDKFRQAMPARLETNLSQESRLSSDEPRVKPIQKSNFYGGRKSSSDERSPSPVKRVASTRPPLSPLKAPVASTSKSSDSSEPKKSDSLKKSTSSSSLSTRPKPVFHRVSSSGKITKRKHALKKKFGMNKGVQHGIRKPVLKKSKLKKPTKKSSATRLKNIEDILREVLEAPTSEASASTRSSTTTPSSFKPTIKKRGKIAVADKARNVSYEIRNGFPVFRLRPSPKKNSTNSFASVASTRKTPAKLFTPSGSGDYLSGSPLKCVKRRGPALPSPVKFDVVADDDDDEETGNAVAGLIASLSDDEDDEEVSMRPATVSYTLTVDDEEAARMAMPTMDELEELNFEAACLDGAKNASPLKSPRKALRMSPRKHVDTTSVTQKCVTPRKSPAKKVSVVSDAIKNILAQMPPTTEEEIRAKRTPKAAAVTLTSGMPTPLAEIGNTPVKHSSGSAKSANKVFPIFEKGFAEKLSLNSAEKKKKLTENASLPRRKLQLASTVHGDASSGLTQSVIDAGQKKIGPDYCLLCDFVYTPGDAEEERMHMEKHEQISGIIRFSGWKNEHVLSDFDDGKIVLVRSGDHKRHWSKVTSILEVVDQSLGVSHTTGIRNPDQSKAYLFINEGRVVGFLLAETISKADEVSMAVTSGSSHSNSAECTLKEVSADQAKQVLVGVSRIWVESSSQRRKVATRLVDAMRSDFIPGKYLKSAEMAFTHTTPNGTAFASKYFKQSKFLVYVAVTKGEENMEF